MSTALAMCLPVDVPETQRSLAREEVREQMHWRQIEAHRELTGRNRERTIRHLATIYVRRAAIATAHMVLFPYEGEIDVVAQSTARGLSENDIEHAMNVTESIIPLLQRVLTDLLRPGTQVPERGTRLEVFLLRPQVAQQLVQTLLSGLSEQSCPWYYQFDNRIVQYFIDKGAEEASRLAGTTFTDEEIADEIVNSEYLVRWVQKIFRSMPVQPPHP